MKLKFKKQAYQTNAVEAVADCFAGQPKREGLNYRIDPGRAVDASGQAVAALESSGFKNADLALPRPGGKNPHGAAQATPAAVSHHLWFCNPQPLYGVESASLIPGRDAVQKG